MQGETSVNRRDAHALAGTAAVEERMSQRDVERTLGRLLTDQGFQDDFFLDPVHACLQVGIQLTPHEVEALLRVPRPGLASLGTRLDDRICRLHIQRSDIVRHGD
jgi:hypothetical protein